MKRLKNGLIVLMVLLGLAKVSHATDVTNEVVTKYAYLECVDESQNINKFYKMSLIGETIFVEYGKIGTKGRKYEYVASRWDSVLKSKLKTYTLIEFFDNEVEIASCGEGCRVDSDCNGYGCYIGEFQADFGNGNIEWVTVVLNPAYVGDGYRPVLDCLGVEYSEIVFDNGVTMKSKTSSQECCEWAGTDSYYADGGCKRYGNIGLSFDVATQTVNVIWE